MSKLLIAPCTYQAAKYAVEHWHYSKSMPAAKNFTLGVWENDQFIGAVIFGLGANNNIAKPYGLSSTQVCELTRLALNHHVSPVSQILGKSIKIMAKANPGIKLVVSYADADQDHLGVIYQATNWIYEGKKQAEGRSANYIINGQFLHGRKVYGLYGQGSQKLSWLQENVDPNASYASTKGKHKYLYPLDSETRKMILLLAKPYPKRASVVNRVTSDDQSEGGGSSLTRTLNTDETDSDKAGE